MDSVFFFGIHIAMADDTRRSTFFLHLNSSSDEERNGLLISLWVCDVMWILLEDLMGEGRRGLALLNHALV